MRNLNAHDPTHIKWYYKIISGLTIEPFVPSFITVYNARIRVWENYEKTEKYHNNLIKKFNRQLC